MIIGALQFELLIHDAESLKDKRRVVKSVKDRLHREHMVAVAEIGALESLNVAVLGLAVVGTDGQKLGETLDRISAKLMALHDAELGAVHRELLRGTPGEMAPAGTLAAGPGGEGEGEGEGDLASELLAYIDAVDEEDHPR